MSYHDFFEKCKNIFYDQFKDLKRYAYIEYIMHISGSANGRFKDEKK